MAMNLRLEFKDCFVIHSVICLTTDPTPLPKWFRHIVRSRASSFKWEYPLLSLRLSSSFLHLLPRLLVTSISPFIFPSITCFRRQFCGKMWPIQLAFRFLYCIHQRNNADRTYLRCCPARAWNRLRYLGVREGCCLSSVTFADFNW